MEAERQLQLETEAALKIIDALKDDMDEDLVTGMIEGETELKETIEFALAEMAIMEAYVLGLKEKEAELKERRERFSARAEKIRNAISKAMDAIGKKKWVFDTGTLSMRQLPAKVIVYDESKIPTQFWKPQDPTLDKVGLRKAMADGDIPGAGLSNGGMTLSIRRK